MNSNHKQNNVIYNDYLEIMVIIEYFFYKKRKNIPFERGDIIIVLRIAVIVHTHKKTHYISNMHYPYPSYTRVTTKTKK